MYRISISPEEINELKSGAFPGKIYVIDKLGEDFDKAIAYLKRQDVIGFDTETKPEFEPGKRRHGTALMQLSGSHKAFLFRIKDIGMPEELCKILASSRIKKIGAACYDDLRGLKKYCGFEPKSFVDLQQIAWEYGIKDKSVKKLAAIILGIHISKKEQCSNWEANPLTESQQLYAATDAWVCREMYFKLMASEKNPLTPEQMAPPMDPVQKALKEAKAKAAAEKQAQQQALTPSERKKRLNRKRKARRKAAKLRLKAQQAAAAKKGNDKSTTS